MIRAVPPLRNISAVHLTAKSSQLYDEEKERGKLWMVFLFCRYLIDEDNGIASFFRLAVYFMNKITPLI